MAVQLKKSEKRNNRLWFGVVIIIIALSFWLDSYNSSPKTYRGEVYIEPASGRSKEYLAFKLSSEGKTQSFMVLVKELDYYAKIKSFRCLRN